MEDEDLRLSLRALSITRNILKFTPMKRLLRLLDAMVDETRSDKRMDAFGAYAASLASYDLDPAGAFLSFLTQDLNAYAKIILKGDTPAEEIDAMLHKELKVLNAASHVTPESMRTYLNYDAYHGYFPFWKKGEIDIEQAYMSYLDTARVQGFGMYRDHHMFVLRHNQVSPVTITDPIAWNQLEGYEYQRNLVWKNTKLLAEKQPASNILLYGDSGTGKSSTVKAVANAMSSEGVRLIEIRKSQLHQIPELLEELSQNSLSFILFIDDLSFLEEDDDFVALKGILEGSILSQAANVVVYATSNRRRLIKETFSQRGSDDVHANETVQQMAALSDRFGLTIPFMGPKREAYLQIVASIAAGRGITIAPEVLFEGAEKFALEKGGRSGRAARQFIDQIALREEI